MTDWELDWKLKDKTTGLNHNVRTRFGLSTAITQCGRTLTIDGHKMPEMPPRAIITCFECLRVG